MESAVYLQLDTGCLTDTHF